jgi:hypothetical protein
MITAAQAFSSYTACRTAIGSLLKAKAGRDPHPKEPVGAINDSAAETILGSDNWSDICVWGDHPVEIHNVYDGSRQVVFYSEKYRPI